MEAGDLSPFKARFLLMIALSQPDMGPGEICFLFNAK